MIEIIRITRETEETKNYDSCTFFVIRNDWNTEIEIFCSAPAIGFSKRTDITIADLLNHLENLKSDGFTITKEKIYK